MCIRSGDAKLEWYTYTSNHTWIVGSRGGITRLHIELNSTLLHLLRMPSLRLSLSVMTLKVYKEHKLPNIFSLYMLAAVDENKKKMQNIL